MSELTRRLLAGLWFAIAGIIPIAFYSLVLRDGNLNQFPVPFSLLFVVTPIVIAGVSGLALGYSILDPNEIKSSGQAMARGLMVALLAYLLFFITSGLILAVGSNNTGGGNGSGFFIAWVIVFIYGFIYVGWLIALVGLVGGLLLYLYRLKRLDVRDQEEIPTHD